MRNAYTPNNFSSFDYPEDMIQILGYLAMHGELHVSAERVEELYREFSEESAAGWLTVNEYELASFANWLSKV